MCPTPAPETILPRSAARAHDNHHRFFLHRFGAADILWLVCGMPSPLSRAKEEVHNADEISANKVFRTLVGGKEKFFNPSGAELKTGVWGRHLCLGLVIEAVTLEPFRLRMWDGD